MKILVSACLLGENCKYNGGNNFTSELQKILEDHVIISVCPEVMGGLTTPRDPNEIVNGIVLTDKGVNRDKEFREGAKSALELALREDADLVILQPRSPSCGVGTIYDGTFSKVKIPGNGVFAEILLKNGFEPLIDFEKYNVLIKPRNFEDEVYIAVSKIPPGKVTTYGEIAILSGHQGAARAVGNALHKNPYEGIVPCHRVVNAKGMLADDFVFGGKDVQRKRLESEGIVVKNNRVDLDKYCL